MNDLKSTSALRAAARKALIVAAFAAIASCVSTGPPTTRPASGGQTQNLEARALAAVQRGDFTSAAELYAQLAASVSGSLRPSYLIESARLSAERGDAPLARRRLGDARAGASRDQLQAITVLSARLEAGDRRPQAALDLLATLQPPSPDPVLRDAAAVRGQALFQLGRHADAVRALVEREVWLEDSAAILANQRMIWEGFRQYPPPATTVPTGDRVVDGWLALAPLATSGGYRSAPLIARVAPDVHGPSGRGRAARGSFVRAARDGLPRADRIAVAADFAAAHPRARGSRRLPSRAPAQLGRHATRLSGSTTPSKAARRTHTCRRSSTAPSSSSGRCSGPTSSKSSRKPVSCRRSRSTSRQTETPLLRSFYQFSLSPDDEARVIARLRWRPRARSTAIAFVPSTDRGYRTLASFRAAIRGARRHAARLPRLRARVSQDFSQPIAGVLNVTRSQQRQRRLAANLGTAIQFEPRRRQDVDMIFIAAEDTRAGRLLAPQLRFNSARRHPDVCDLRRLRSRRHRARQRFERRDHSRTRPRSSRRIRTRCDLQREMLSVLATARQPSALVRDGLRRLRARELALQRRSRRVARARNVRRLSLDETGKIHRALPLAQFRNGRPAAYEIPVGGDRRRASSSARADMRLQRGRHWEAVAADYLERSRPHCARARLSLPARRARPRLPRRARSSSSSRCARVAASSYGSAIETIDRTNARRIVQATRHFLMRHARMAATHRFASTSSRSTRSKRRRPRCNGSRTPSRQLNRRTGYAAE